ncbi:MAG: aminodeoxychorismate lyase [Gammaproteobacteria bacterium]|nr:aminodeoxychorismate lyase [Gammaproteobacteria bacterium]
MTLINGKQQTLIDVADRGLSYGDGLFETIAYVDGALHNWYLHWQRLKFGAQRLVIELPDELHILSQIDTELSSLSEPELLQNKQNMNRVIKVIVTRGQGGRGYLFPQPQNCTVIISAHPWPQRAMQDYTQGVHAMVCQTCLAIQPALAGIKHLNRLEQILGRNEFHHSDYQEGIMLACSDDCSENPSRQDPLMVEGTSSNLFFVYKGKLCTPKIHTCGVLGTIREAILLLAPQIGIAAQQGNYPLQQLREATEVFFTNSVYGILPIATITVHDDLQWRYTERKITTQLAATINKALKRPDRFN